LNTGLKTINEKNYFTNAWCVNFAPTSQTDKLAKVEKLEAARQEKEKWEEKLKERVFEKKMRNKHKYKSFLEETFILLIREQSITGR
jgi:hypothetical protein